MGRSFVVGHMNLQPGEKATRKVHKVWYDLVYDFGEMAIDGSKAKLHYEIDGVYFAKEKHIRLSEVLKLATEEANPEDDSKELDDEGEVFHEADDSLDLSGVSDSASIQSTQSVKHAETKDGGEPLKEHAVAASFPCTPVEMFDLKFKNEEFRTWQRKRSQPDVSNIEESEWKKREDGREFRTSSFTMKLSGSVGPSSTRCDIVEEVEHFDEEQYIAVVGTTRTPDVPYGSSFHTETRTVFTWSSSGGCKMSVSFATIWDKSSILKGVIDKASSSGQRSTNKKLIVDLQTWISEHSDEYERADKPTQQKR